jgi:hypothetical protein
MKIKILLIAGLLSLSILAETSKKHYGKEFNWEKFHTLDQLITMHKENKSNTVNLKAKVIKVCQKKGCWMGLKASDKEVRVTFEGYSFFVPMSLINKEVVLRGKLEEKTISKSVARHYLEDEGKSKEEINKIKGPVKEYNFIASGVQVL